MNLELIATQLGYVTLSSALTILALWLARSLIEARLTKSIQFEFDQKLETLRSNLRQSEESMKAEVRAKEAEIDALRSSVMAGMSARQTALDKRRIEACDHVWAQAMLLQRFSGLVMILAAVDYDDASRRAASDSRFRGQMEGIMSAFKMDEFSPIDGTSAQPYLSDLAWAIFYAYKNIVAFAFVRKQVIISGLSGSASLTQNPIARLLKAALPDRASEIESYGDIAAAKLMPELTASLIVELKRIIEGKEDDMAGAARAAEVLAQVRALQAEMNVTRTGT